jgi:hypothetical protein
MNDFGAVRKEGDKAAHLAGAGSCRKRNGFFCGARFPRLRPYLRLRRKGVTAEDRVSAESAVKLMAARVYVKEEIGQRRDLFSVPNVVPEKILGRDKVRHTRPRPPRGFGEGEVKPLAIHRYKDVRADTPEEALRPPERAAGTRERPQRLAYADCGGCRDIQQEFKACALHGFGTEPADAPFRTGGAQFCHKQGGEAVARGFSGAHEYGKICVKI